MLVNSWIIKWKCIILVAPSHKQLYGGNERHFKSEEKQFTFLSELEMRGTAFPSIPEQLGGLPKD